MNRGYIFWRNIGNNLDFFFLSDEVDKLEPKECLPLHAYSFYFIIQMNHPFIMARIQSSEEDFLVFLTYCLNPQFAEKRQILSNLT